MPKLLLADDSVTIQRVIELTFAEEDVEVLTAGDGEQAISKIQSDRPDIVLADIGMPKRSGYDVAAFVKGQPEFAHIPVLLLTGAFEPVDETRAQAAGCDGVLVKPFEPQHVIARVRELLQADPARQRQRAGNVTRAVSDVPRPAERLAPPRGSANHGHEIGFPREAGGRGAADTSLDDYFDRLDAAFANLSSSAAETPVRHPEVMPRGEGPVMEKDLDWFDAPLSSVPAEAPSPQPVVEPPPATFATPPSPLEWPLPQAASIERPDAPPELAAYAQPAQAPPPAAAETSGSAIADAFSALLAVEQGEPGAAPVRLMLNPAPPAVNEQLIEEITRRVVERLAPQALREVVADVVSDVSERLVRDEIQRIRNQANHDS
jgi:CheY-like chemotaxis protein